MYHQHQAPGLQFALISQFLSLVMGSYCVVTLFVILSEFRCNSIGGGAIFLVGCSSGETKLAEGIRDAKNRRFVITLHLLKKVGGYSPPPGSAAHEQTYIIY